MDAKGRFCLRVGRVDNFSSIYFAKNYQPLAASTGKDQGFCNAKPATKITF